MTDFGIEILSLRLAQSAGARDTKGAVTSIAAGALVRVIAPSSRVGPWIVGLVMVALFVPVHIQLWTRFPIWYHLTFLLTLAPLVALGASLLPRERVGEVRL